MVSQFAYAGGAARAIMTFTVENAGRSSRQMRDIEENTNGSVLTQEIQIVQQTVLVHSNKHGRLGVSICGHKFIIPSDP